MSQVLESLAPMLETGMEYHAHRFSLAQSWLLSVAACCSYSGSKNQMEDSLSPSLTFSHFITLLFKEVNLF